MIALAQAAALYRGPFLASFPLPTSLEFELWAGLERNAWERLYLELLATLVEAQSAQKRTLLFQALVRVLLHLTRRQPPLCLADIYL